MRILKSFGIIFFSCAVIFLFSDARRAAERKLREGNATWYLEQVVDSAGFFSKDTLKFINPTPGFFQVTTYTNGIPDKENGADTLRLHPQIKFGPFQKNEFEINLDWKEDTFLINGNTGQVWSCGKTLEGKYSVKNKIIAFDFYEMDKNHPTDYINDWIKWNSKKYSILEFSKSKLVLLKIKNPN